MILTDVVFKSIYDQYSVLVYNIALNYVQNIEDAEEISQDVFIKIYHSTSKFNEKSTLKTWIYRITINTSLDFIKQKKRKKYLYVFGHKEQNYKEVQDTSNFEHPGILLENKEYSEILYQVINTLPENQKTAFILSKLDGVSNIEIAEIMQLSISSVESLLFRAKSNLKEKLKLKFKEYHKK